MKKLLILFSALLLLSSCSAEVTLSECEIFAMDTYMTIKAYGETSGTALAEAENLIHSLNSLWAVNNPNSEIYKLNSDKTITPSPETAEIIQFALDMCEKTNGAFDISIYPVASLWGFVNGNTRLPDSAEITNALKLTGCEKIVVADDSITIASGEIDLGGIAKGYASDKVAQLLLGSGVNSAIISLGGNVYALGLKPDGEMWNVGIQNPFETNGYAGAVKVTDVAVVTSGSYERNFSYEGKVYHHILNPDTGYPAESGLVSVTIIGPSGVEADCLSTAFFVMGLENSIEYLNTCQSSLNAIFITDNKEIYITKGIAEKFELLDESLILHVLD